MFTGLVEEMGRVFSVVKRGHAAKITVSARAVVSGTKIGDSISINGACQTVVAITKNGFTVDTLGETLKKTTLGSLRRGSVVNLERSLTLEQGLGGHLVQGHVNGTAAVADVIKKKTNIYLRIKLAKELPRYCVREGSIAIDGVSLTLAQIKGSDIFLNIIPHTFFHTTLQYRRRGDLVNVETDILGRYAEKSLAAVKKNPLTAEKLKSWGY